ncbi:MAG: MurR/RpiR family transcriptional regulator [Armatimonadota bacterium]
MTPEIDASKTELSKGTVFSRIQSMSASGKKSAAAISAYVLQHSEAVLQMTLTELAARVGTSVASISRYCSMLGYENYRAFQIDLTASLANNATSVSDLFGSEDDTATIMKRVFEMNRQGLADTESLMKHDDMVEVAKLITASRRICLLGIGGSGLVARSSALKLASLGITALAITDPYEGILTLSSSTPEDVLIAISHSGRSGLIIELLELAKEKGARTVGITNYSDTTLANLCEYTLLTSFRERRINAAVSSSSIEQLCILDALYFLIAHLQGPISESMVMEIETNAERIIRAR